jgi:predicted RNase H-like HicB family nuclease
MSSRTLHFTVLIEQDEDGWYVATVPALRGCHTQAQTIAELDGRIKEAIALCLEVNPSRSEDVSQHRFIGVHELEIAI